jgi:diadenylate cyclase
MDIFKIGFLNVRIIDIVDILIIAYLFYKLYTVMKGTIAAQLFIALVLITGFSLLAQALNMQAMGWLLSKITDIWVIAFIILFQPEIRRLLLIIGKTRVAKIFMKTDVNENVNEVVDACVEMKAKGWGALIVIERTTGLQNVVETGEIIESKINKEILISIFNPKSPLHDGAVILKNNKIEAARCVLPLADAEKISNKNLGTRHRAGIGISEVSDAVAIILSEETGKISLAEDGKLIITKDVNDLRERLRGVMKISTMATSVRSIFTQSEKDYDEFSDEEKKKNKKTGEEVKK